MTTLRAVTKWRRASRDSVQVKVLVLVHVEIEIGERHLHVVRVPARTTTQARRSQREHNSRARRRSGRGRTDLNRCDEVSSYSFGHVACSSAMTFLSMKWGMWAGALRESRPDAQRQVSARPHRSGQRADWLTEFLGHEAVDEPQRVAVQIE